MASARKVFGYQSETFTSVRTGAILNCAGVPGNSYAIQVKGTGATAGAWTAILEGSLDGVNFSTMMTHNTATGDGAVLWSGSNIYPSMFFRINITALTLGSATNIVVTTLGTN